MGLVQRGMHTALIAYHIALGLLQFTLSIPSTKEQEEYALAGSDANSVVAFLTVLTKATGLLQFGIASIFVALGRENLRYSSLIQVLLLVGHLGSGRSPLHGTQGAWTTQADAEIPGLLQARSQLLALSVTLVLLGATTFMSEAKITSGKVQPGDGKVNHSKLSPVLKHRRSQSASNITRLRQVAKQVDSPPINEMYSSLGNNDIWASDGNISPLKPSSSLVSLNPTTDGGDNVQSSLLRENAANAIDESVSEGVVEDGFINHSLVMLIATCHLLIGCAVLADESTIAWPHGQSMSHLGLQVLRVHSKQLGTLSIAIASALPLVPKPNRASILVTIVLARATHAWIDFFEGPTVNDIHPSVGVNVALATVALAAVMYEKAYPFQNVEISHNTRKKNR